MDQIFITCGDIQKFEQNSVFAVIVPQREPLKKWAEQNGINGDFTQLCESLEIMEMVYFFLTPISISIISVIIIITPSLIYYRFYKT